MQTQNHKDTRNSGLKWAIIRSLLYCLYSPLIKKKFMLKTLYQTYHKNKGFFYMNLDTYVARHEKDKIFLLNNIISHVN